MGGKGWLKERGRAYELSYPEKGGGGVVREGVLNRGFTIR